MEEKSQELNQKISAADFLFMIANNADPNEMVLHLGLSNSQMPHLWNNDHIIVRFAHCKGGNFNIHIWA